jgi:hypothetical protein
MKATVFLPRREACAQGQTLVCAGLDPSILLKGAGLRIKKGASHGCREEKALLICSGKETEPPWKERQEFYTAFYFRTTVNKRPPKKN